MASATSRRLWFWIAFFVGPLAPIVLLVSSDRRDSEANHAYQIRPLRKSNEVTRGGSDFRL